MKRILCIWLLEWPIQRIVVARPELEGQLLLLHAADRRGRRVVRCSDPARAAGVAEGMPLAEAVAVCSAEVVQEPCDPVADREALEKLAVWCQQFSPLVGVETASEPESLLLDITGLEHLFGGEASLAERIRRAFAQRKLKARIAIADTLGAAWAAAHFIGVSPGLRLNGAMCHSPIIPPGQVLAAFRPLPLEAMRLPGDAIGLLHSLGLYTIGQLERVPRADLAARFGPRLAERWDQALGRLAEPIPSQQAPPELEARQSLEYPVAQRETVEAVLETLIGRVAQMLVRCGRGALRLDCRLSVEDAVRAAHSQPLSGKQEKREIDLSVGLFQPTASARHLMELVRMQLERVSLPGPVHSVSVAATATAPAQVRQEELFSDGPPRQRPRLLAALINRLASRLGRQSVLRARLVADAQPESAYQYDPLVECRKQASTKREEALPPRPLKVIRQPVPLAPTAAVANGTVVSNGPPARFRYRGQEHRIARLWGPERIETGWWRGPMVARDYYRIETTTGRRFWLFCRLADGRWFMHGAFE